MKNNPFSYLAQLQTPPHRGLILIFMDTNHNTRVEFNYGLRRRELFEIWIFIANRRILEIGGGWFVNQL